MRQALLYRLGFLGPGQAYLRIMLRRRPGDENWQKRYLYPFDYIEARWADNRWETRPYNKTDREIEDELVDTQTW
tara:strand:- start:242 stop:466 length:225 start_codon:yes stop_codon:yes gene_type:complete